VTLRNLAITLADDGKLRISEIGDPLELWEATRRFFKERRPTRTGHNDFTYPDTTNADVRQLAEVWDRVHNRLWRSDLARAGQFRTQWRDARSAIEVATAGADLGATFGENETFWLRWTKRQAIYLSAVRDMPSKWETVVDSVKGAVVRLPETLGSALDTAGDAAVSVAAATGRIAAAPARGLFDGLFGSFGRPLLIGTAIVGGIVLVPRLLGHHHTADVRGPAEGSS
jgi:hypothetical protein